LRIHSWKGRAKQYGQCEIWWTKARSEVNKRAKKGKVCAADPITWSQILGRRLRPHQIRHQTLSQCVSRIFDRQG
jgi:hypothetical protein